MNSRLKFIAADTACLGIMLYALICHYSLFGLVSFFIGGLLLYLGTLVGKNIKVYGLTFALDYIIFIMTLTLFGIWFPYIVGNSNNFAELRNRSSGWWILFAFLSGFCIYVANKVKSWVLHKFFLHLSVPMIIIVLLLFFRLRFFLLYPIIATALVFFIIDTYKCKMIMQKDNGFIYKKVTYSYGISIFISFQLLVFEMIAPTYINSFFLNLNSIKNIFCSALSTRNVVVFVVFMVVLSAVCRCFVGVNNNSGADYRDACLFLSIGGFAASLAMYLVHTSVNTFIVLSSLLILLTYIQFNLIEYSNNWNKLKGKYSDKYLVIIAILSILAVLSELFVHKHSLVSWIVSICGIIFVLASKKIPSEKSPVWLKNNISYQATLIAIFIFIISVVLIEKMTSDVLLFAIYTFLISSLGLWVFGHKDGVTREYFKYFKLFDCIMYGASCVLLVL